MDYMLTFRERHTNAVALVERMVEVGSKPIIPAHAFFEYAVTAIIHYKAGDFADDNQLKTDVPDSEIDIITISGDYVRSLLAAHAGTAVPDLKSQDMIYYFIAKDRNVPLVTEDQKLHKIMNKSGLTAFKIDEAIAFLADGT